MLSRVAAVKAPRTHNRRGVTGSSGRRRKGSESEPPRPNMSRRVFTSAVLLLVVMMCCSTCGAAAAVVKQSSDPKFQWKGISEGDVTVESLGAPGLLKVGSGVFAVAEAQCKKDGEGADNVFTGVASQLVTMDKGNEPKEVLKDAKEKTQVLEEGGSTEGKKVDVSRPTTVVDESNIYMLVGKHSRNAGGQESGAAQSGLFLVKGEFSDKESKKQIDWKDTNAVPKTPLGEQLSYLKRLIGGGGSGVKMKDGTLVFPLEGTKKKDKTEDDGKTVSLLIYSSDTENWTLSKGMSADGCSDPSVVEWKDKLMMMTACDDGRRRVYESADKGASWTEALGTLSRVWSSKQEGEGKAVGSGFITATFGDDDKNVMLVTLPVYAKENGEKGELHLWLTDNTHIVDIGPVSGDDDAAASALLYKSAGSGTDEEKKEELIALYEKKKVGDEKPSHSLWSVLLTEQLQRVKDVLATWKEVDEHVSELCSSESAVKARSNDSACSTKITAGLVGFLSGNFSDGTWKDEYLGVNATVKKGAPAEKAETAESSDGVKFTGRGAWAEWPVSCQGENQLYHFANYKFTLVATVSIDGEPTEGNIPLMGAKVNEGDDKTVLLGLSYNKEKKWILLCGGGENKELSSHWEPGKAHQVAIVLQNGNQSTAYVDGVRVEDETCSLENTNSKGISHFYIGGDGGNTENTESQEGFSVTVSNVLLYNRPLDDDEIAGLAKNTITIPKPEDPKKSAITPRSPEVSGLSVEGTVTQSNSAGQLLSEQEQPKGSNDAGAGGASTPPTSTAATSLGKEPVHQQTSGTSPSGNKNVDASSSSDADPAVVTGSGETVQGDGSPQIREVTVSSGADGETAGGTDGQEEEEIHPQAGEVNATALSSSLGNLSQGNNSDAGTVSGSGLLPLLLLLLGLWGFAAL
ncbi:putative trans-sialidase, Group V [Trypanosoma cruzi]|nr:putative trans-sialidase, Group V [Trypanosoma cruzi]